MGRETGDANACEAAQKALCNRKSQFLQLTFLSETNSIFLSSHLSHQPRGFTWSTHRINQPALFNTTTSYLT